MPWDSPFASTPSRPPDPSCSPTATAGADQVMTCGSPNCFRTRNWGRCARPLWRREKWCCVRPGRRSYCDAVELVDQDGAGDHRQELSIVAESTRVRLLSPVVPPDGVTWCWPVVWGRVRGAVA